MKIPFVDLKIQYSNYKDEINLSIANVINDTAFVKGKYVNDFENAFSKKNGVKHCIGVGNGTDALFIVLKMLGIGKGDEVITTALSWISTSETITQVGAKPVFVDIDEYFLIDVDKIEAKITKKTKAIIPVHLYGQSCDMDKIMSIAKHNGLFVIEDCAQAHFAEFKGKKVGTFGHAATFSFYPGKNLGAYGDAGAILTNDTQLALKCRMFANHGALKKHYHEIEGINSRLDGLQAAILSFKLDFIDHWNFRRFEIAKRYNELLKQIAEIKTPKINTDSKHIFHVYCIIADDRDGLMGYLNKIGIDTQIHYPTMLPFMPAYNYLNYKFQDFPNAYSIQNKILSLPMYPELKIDQIKYITDKVYEYYFNKNPENITSF